jgi:hypothetical protein
MFPKAPTRPQLQYGGQQATEVTYGLWAPGFKVLTDGTRTRLGHQVASERARYLRDDRQSLQCLG